MGCDEEVDTGERCRNTRMYKLGSRLGYNMEAYLALRDGFFNALRWRLGDFLGDKRLL